MKIYEIAAIVHTLGLGMGSAAEVAWRGPWKYAMGSVLNDCGVSHGHFPECSGEECPEGAYYRQWIGLKKDVFVTH